MPVPPDFPFTDQTEDKTHLSSEGNGSLSSDCFPNQKVEQPIPRADNTHAAWVKSVQCLLSTAISFFNGKPAERSKELVYSKDKRGAPFYSGLTWQAGV